MPKVSIVLPTYNGEKYIEESVESILCQTFEDWELIIVDDCSSDRTGKIADNFAKSDSRIQVIHNKNNEKLPGALNIGFRKAKGDYLTWTSDDNRYLSHALETMVRFLDADPAYAMVCTGMLIFDDKWNFLSECAIYSDDAMFLDDVVGASFMYRRKILDEVGEYDPDMFCVEDYEYWIRILEHGNRIKYLDGIYYLYRRHAQSLTVAKRETVRKQQRRLYIRHLDWILKGICSDTVRLMRVYGEIIRCKDVEFEQIRTCFSEYLPLLRYDMGLPENAKYCLYGAGEMGRKMAVKLDKVECFADRNRKVTGTTIGGIPVLSVENIMDKVKNDENLHIIISVSFEKQYEVIENLVNHGIKAYSIMEHIE